MKNKALIAISFLSLLPGIASAQTTSGTNAGVSYEQANVDVGGYSTDVRGLRFQAASELSWGNIKGAAASLSNSAVDYNYYSLSVEKPIAINASDFYIAPEAGITYADLSAGQYGKSDFGPELGMSLGYNINDSFQVQSHYSHLFGMKSSQTNIKEDSIGLGVNYRFQ